MATVLFRLREYDDAFRDLFGRVMRAHAEEAYPLLKEIPTEPRPDIHTSQVTLPSGEPLKNEPFEMEVPFRFNLSDMINGDVDAFTASVEASGSAYGEDIMRNLLKYSGAISEAMGTAVDGRGKRFGWPVIIEVLEGVEIDFDERGEPELPTMISDRDLSRSSSDSIPGVLIPYLTDGRSRSWPQRCSCWEGPNRNCSPNTYSRSRNGSQTDTTETTSVSHRRSLGRWRRGSTY